MSKIRISSSSAEDNQEEFFLYEQAHKLLEDTEDSCSKSSISESSTPNYYQSYAISQGGSPIGTDIIDELELQDDVQLRSFSQGNSPIPDFEKAIESYKLAIDNNHFNHINLTWPHDIHTKTTDKAKTNIGNIRKISQDGINTIKVIRKQTEEDETDCIREVTISVLTRLFSNTRAFFAQNKVFFSNNPNELLLFSKEIDGYINMRQFLEMHIKNYRSEYSNIFSVEEILKLITPENSFHINGVIYEIDFDSLAIVMFFILLTQDIDGIGFGLLNIGFVKDTTRLKLIAAKIDYGYGLSQPYYYNILKNSHVFHDYHPIDFNHPSYIDYLSSMKEWIVMTDKKIQFNSEAKFPMLMDIIAQPQHYLDDRTHNKDSRKGVYNINLFKLISVIPENSIKKALSAVMAINQSHINELFLSTKAHFTNEFHIKYISALFKMFSLNVSTFQSSLSQEIIDQIQPMIDQRRIFLDKTPLRIQKLDYTQMSFRQCEDKRIKKNIDSIYIVK